jgi:glutathione S-transferase
MAEPSITLYRALASRAYPVLWLLEELGQPFRSEIVRLRGDRDPPLLALNPTGRVPILTDGETVVSEAPAICLYLADRYGYGGLAPRADEPDRGPYLKWMVYSTAVLEPARELQLTTVTPPKNDWGVGWGPWDQVLGDLAGVLAGRTWLLGERFSAADVMLGSVLGIGLFCEMIPPEPAFVAYRDRLEARPANERARALNWPAEQFGG